MVNIFFLLAKELGAYSIESVASKLIIALHDLQDVKLQSSFHVDRF